MTNENEFLEDQEAFSEGEEISAEDFMTGGGNFIKSPEVGESVTFFLKTIKQQKAKTVTNPKTKKPMDIGLSKVDYYYDYVDDEGKALSVSAWQIVGKTKAIIKKLGGKFGFNIKIEHVADGRTAPQGTDAWKVYAEVDGTFKELSKEGEWV